MSDLEKLLRRPGFQYWRKAWRELVTGQNLLLALRRAVQARDLGEAETWVEEWREFVEKEDPVTNRQLHRIEQFVRCTKAAVAAAVLKTAHRAGATPPANELVSFFKAAEEAVGFESSLPLAEQWLSAEELYPRTWGVQAVDSVFQWFSEVGDNSSRIGLAWDVTRALLDLPRLEQSCALPVAGVESKVGFIATLVLEAVQPGRGNVCHHYEDALSTSANDAFQEAMLQAWQTACSSLAAEGIDTSTFDGRWRLIRNGRPAASANNRSASATAALGWWHVLTQRSCDEGVLILAQVDPNDPDKFCGVDGIGAKCRSAAEHGGYDTLVVASDSNRRQAVEALREEPSPKPARIIVFEPPCLESLVKIRDQQAEALMAYLQGLCGFLRRVLDEHRTSGRSLQETTSLLDTAENHLGALSARRSYRDHEAGQKPGCQPLLVGISWPDLIDCETIESAVLLAARRKFELVQPGEVNTSHLKILTRRIREDLFTHRLIIFSEDTQPEQHLRLCHQDADPIFRAKRSRSDVPLLQDRTIEEVFALWFRDAQIDKPLIIIPDFVADGQPTLLSLARSIARSAGTEAPNPRSVHWIQGDSWLIQSLNRDVELPQIARLSSKAASGPQATMDQDHGSTVPGSANLILLLDLSRVWRSEPLRFYQEGSLALMGLFSWLLQEGHRVVAVLPKRHARLLQAAEKEGRLDWVFVAQPLFLSKRREAPRASCSSWPPQTLGSLLESFRNTNSPSLNRYLEGFLSNEDLDWEAERVGGSVADRILGELTEGLEKGGYFEIAYRLSLHRRHAYLGSRNTVSLDADVHYPHSKRTSPSDGEKTTDETIKGFIHCLEKAPAHLSPGGSTRNGSPRWFLTGPAGTGKAKVLELIEHWWSLPRIHVDEVEHPCWVPVKLKIAAIQSANDVKKRVIQADFRNLGLRRQVTTPDQVPLLFSSPVLFLLQLSPADIAAEDLEEELDHIDNCCPRYSRCGQLVSTDASSASAFDHLIRMEIRPLSSHQVLEFLRVQRGPDWVRGVLGPVDSPMCEHVRNLFLLTRICQQDRSCNLSPKFGLHQVLHNYVEGKKKEGENAVNICEQWLPQVALHFKTAGRGASHCEELRQELQRSESGSIREAQDLGLLRDTGDRIEFSHELLLDYFAAKQLATERKANGLQRVLENSLCATTNDLGRWRNVFLISVGFLSNRDLGAFFRHLLKKAPVLACSCLLELSPKKRYQLKRWRSIRKIVGKKIKTQRWGRSAKRREVVSSLGFIEPRITLADPLAGTVKIYGIEPGDVLRIGRFPVTNMEFAEFVRDRGYEQSQLWNENWPCRRSTIDTPKHWYDRDFNRPNYPVVGVSFYEAVAYCRWLSSRPSQAYEFCLPTHSEWDLVAHGWDFVKWLQDLRAKLRDIYPKLDFNSTNVWDLMIRVLGGQGPAAEGAESKRLRKLLKELKPSRYLDRYLEQLSHEGPSPVGVFEPNPFGCHDLFGGVWEWCDTWLPVSPQRPSVTREPTGEPVIVKGGRWRQPGQDLARALLGGWFDPSTRFHELGFRICAKPKTGKSLT